MAEVGAADPCVNQGGCRCPYLEPDLPSIGSVGHDLRVRDVGHDTPHWEGFGRIPPQGGPQAHEEETSEKTGWSMSLTPAGVHDGVGDTTVGGDLCLPSPGHTCKDY